MVASVASHTVARLANTDTPSGVPGQTGDPDDLRDALFPFQHATLEMDKDTGSVWQCSFQEVIFTLPVTVFNWSQINTANYDQKGCQYEIQPISF